MLVLKAPKFYGKTRLLGFCILLNLVFSSWGFAQDPKDGFSTVLFPTTLQDESRDPLRIDVGKIPLSDMPQWLSRLANILPRQKKSVVAVYLPRGLGKLEENNYLEQIKKSFKDYKNVKLAKIYVDVPATIREGEIANRELEEIKKTGEIDMEAKAIDSAIESNNERIEELKTWRAKIRHFGETAFSPNKTIVVGSIINGTRGVFAASLWVASGFNPYFLTLAATDGFINYYFGKHSVSYNEWVIQHEIPFMQSNFLVRFYNRTRVVKAFLFNMAVWSVGYRTFQNAMVYAGATTGVEAPLSSTVIRDMLVLGTLHNVFNALTVDSVGTLGRKNRWSKVVQSYALWSLGIAAQVAIFAQVKGLDSLTPWVLTGFFGVQAGLYLGAKMLSSKPGRYVLLHPLVGQAGLADAASIEPVYAKLDAKDKSFEEIEVELRALERQMELEKRRSSFSIKFRSAWLQISKLVRTTCESLRYIFRLN
jgi:hypothetical protein